MIKVNAIQCPNCKDVVYSRARHDMRYCGCGEVAIDGGFDYNRVAFRGIFPASFEIEVDADKNTLYSDWNKETNKFGLIKHNSEK